ncbi:hypothetical protein FKG94_12525 [Exilibacterium tricleocarpae]|uniref:Uncharacterized protein n=1 Tax=Exilibacterium tricleocarpae TaxID=2591008 RepID=A0A545TNN8_9GAMM|nr:hypothetical protein [Exilibacterium tricleocarpae]TQV78839.1 hypothetical protein FKG94_12525 [Exilibacterium tricleocarpae]
MIQKSYDLYGIDCESLDIARTLIEALLNIVMMAHESGFRCGEYYRLYDVGQEHFILQNNYDDFEGEWTEESFSKYPNLFYVNETNRSSDLKAVLLKDKRVALLKHEEL